MAREYVFARIQILTLQSLDVGLRAMERRGRDQYDPGPKARLDLIDLMAFLIQKEGRYVYREFRKDGFGIFLQCLFLQNPEET